MMTRADKSDDQAVERDPVFYDLQALGLVKKRDTLSGRREGEQAQQEYGIGDDSRESEEGITLILPTSIRVFTPSFFMGLLWKVALKFSTARKARTMISVVGASEVTQQSLEHALNTLLSPRSPLSAFALQEETSEKATKPSLFRRTTSRSK